MTCGPAGTVSGAMRKKGWHRCPSCSIACLPKSITVPKSSGIHDEPEQQLARMGAIEQLREAIKTYSERAESPSLAGFLDDSALLGRDEEPDNEEVASANAVKLMTLHSAKGLEFPASISWDSKRDCCRTAARWRTKKTRSPRSVAWRTSASRGR